VQVVNVGVAVYGSGAPVLLLIFNNCAGGSAWPIWNGKDSELTLVTIAGSFEIPSTTGKDCEPLLAGEPVTVTVPI
jgi:hypothetical protein